MRLSGLIVIALLLLGVAQVNAEGGKENVKQSETYQVGLMVESLQEALILRNDDALQTINLYGTDSRYYSMIRGWLFQELVSVESLLHANKNNNLTDKFQRHSDFLKSAIRSIDLE